jgi:hypothetical protein
VCALEVAVEVEVVVAIRAEQERQPLGDVLGDQPRIQVLLLS